MEVRRAFSGLASKGHMTDTASETRALELFFQIVGLSAGSGPLLSAGRWIPGKTGPEYVMAAAGAG